MEKIFYKKRLVGIRIKQVVNGSNPLTPPGEFVQMLSLKYPKGKYWQPHIHRPRRRVTTRLQEGLFVRKGKIRLDLYTRKREFVKFLYLHQGDAFILLDGGYGIHALKDVELLEFKNGPFKVDKVMF